MTIDRPIAIAITIFITILLVFFLVTPEYKLFKQLQQQLGEKRAEYRAQFDYYNAIAETHAKLQDHQEEIKKIDDALPRDVDLGKLVYSLQETAGISGLTVKNLSLSKSSQAAPSQEMSATIKDLVFSMDLAGDYAALENFIISLEKSSRIFEISSISFSSSPTSSSSNSFSVQIKTHSY